MSSETTKSAYWQGVRDGAPFVLVVFPFSMIFGVVAAEAGLDLLATMTLSAVVVAGAAQFTAVQLLSDQAPAIIALIAALAVNLRLAMYSAALTPHLGATSLRQRLVAAYLTVDQSYGCSVLAFERNPRWSAAQKFRYFCGTVTPIYPLWYLGTLIGAVLGTAIPESYALDFALPMSFIAMVAPLLRTPAHLAAAFTGLTISLLFAFLPYSLGLLVAGFAGMIVGARAELWQDRQRARA